MTLKGYMTQRAKLRGVTLYTMLKNPDNGRKRPALIGYFFRGDAIKGEHANKEVIGEIETAGRIPSVVIE